MVSSTPSLTLPHNGEGNVEDPLPDPPHKGEGSVEDPLPDPPHKGEGNIERGQ